MQTLQTENYNIEITSSTGNASKDLHYHTDFMFKRNTTNIDNRRQFVIQNHYFTYRRKGNNELAIQALNVIVAGLQNQKNNLSSGSGCGDGGGPDGIGTMYVYFNFKKYEIYTNM